MGLLAWEHEARVGGGQLTHSPPSPKLWPTARLSNLRTNHTLSHRGCSAGTYTNGSNIPCARPQHCIGTLTSRRARRRNINERAPTQLRSSVTASSKGTWQQYRSAVRSVPYRSSIASQSASRRTRVGRPPDERDPVKKASIPSLYHRRARPHGSGHLPEVFGEAGTRNQASTFTKLTVRAYTQPIRQQGGPFGNFGWR